jgi:hypothetical protein
MKLEELLMQTIPTLQASSALPALEEFASFPSHPGKGSLKNCLDNLKDLGK